MEPLPTYRDKVVMWAYTQWDLYKQYRNERRKEYSHATTTCMRKYVYIYIRIPLEITHANGLTALFSKTLFTQINLP